MSYTKLKSLLSYDKHLIRYIDEQNKELRLPLAKIARLYTLSPNYLQKHGIEMRIPTFKTVTDVGQSLLEIMSYLKPDQVFEVNIEDLYQKRRCVTIHIKTNSIFIRKHHDYNTTTTFRLAPHTPDDVQSIFWSLIKDEPLSSNLKHDLKTQVDSMAYKGAFTNKQGGYDTHGILRLAHILVEDMHLHGISHYDKQALDRTIKKFMSL